MRCFLSKKTTPRCLDLKNLSASSSGIKFLWIVKIRECFIVFQKATVHKELLNSRILNYSLKEM